MFSHPELGPDPPIGSDRESRCDKLVSESRFRRFWTSFRLRMCLYSNVLKCGYLCFVYCLEWIHLMKL